MCRCEGLVIVAGIPSSGLSPPPQNAPWSHARMQTLAFGTPRKLPRASQVLGRVAVLDIAFAGAGSGGGFPKITQRRCPARPLDRAPGSLAAVFVAFRRLKSACARATKGRFGVGVKAPTREFPLLSPNLHSGTSERCPGRLPNRRDGVSFRPLWSTFP